MELLPTENGAKFLVQFKPAVKQIGEQNMSKKPIDNEINIVLKSATCDREPALYQLANLHDMPLEKLHQQI